MNAASRPSRLIAGGAASILPMALLIALTSPGCGQGELHSDQGSPVVTADSEAARKAIEQETKFLETRKQQEAKASRRNRAMPEPEAEPKPE